MDRLLKVIVSYLSSKFVADMPYRELDVWLPRKDDGSLVDRRNLRTPVLFWYLTVPLQGDTELIPAIQNSAFSVGDSKSVSLEANEFPMVRWRICPDDRRETLCCQGVPATLRVGIVDHRNNPLKYGYLAWCRGSILTHCMLVWRSSWAWPSNHYLLQIHQAVLLMWGDLV